MAVEGYDVVSEQIFGEGNFLQLRRLRLRARASAREGVYDFVERPGRLDAVVLAIHCGERVLLRDAVRIPLVYGRGAPKSPPRLCTEVVAGIVEAGEDSWEALQRRAAAEALEEAGLAVAPSRIERLGPPLFPTPGMCAELFHLLRCEVSAEEAARASHPAGDGSPFEEGAKVRWVALDEALAACARGELDDMKTELILRRLRDRLALQPR